jgi:circadian clock protein KaiC
MSRRAKIARVETGVRNLDALLGGGLPLGSVSIMAGPPGSWKTILSQQICFHNASSKRRALYFSTLSEPTAKTLRYLQQFDFFDADKLEVAVQFIDLGALLRTQGLVETGKLIMGHVKRLKPAFVVIDSFKVFDDLATSREELRKFGYELAVNLMAWECTVLLLGEYGPEDMARNPLFSIVDGLFHVMQREQAGEQQRFIQLVKLRGTEHSRDQHPFVIRSSGVEVFAPRVTIQREDRGSHEPRCKTGIAKLDGLLGDGIPRGSSLLVAGVAGTGKTVLLLEFLYRGAQAGEKGIIFSFEETEERLRAAARGLGWDLEREIARGMLQIVFTAQPNIVVEGHLLMMRERIEAMGARRVAVDSVSVFLHKIEDPQVSREKTFQLASIIQNSQAVGFFATDIPYGSNKISRFGVEETVVDGVILLTSTEEGFERQRYIEVYKLRTTAHLKGRHPMAIGPSGILIFPRYEAEVEYLAPPPALEPARRLSSGVVGLDELLGGGFLARSVTLLSGPSGIGKTTLATQFIMEGAKQKQRGLFVAFEEGPEQITKAAAQLGLPLQAAIDKGLVEIVYLSREHVRANQFLSILADKIQANKTRRLSLDSVSSVMAEGLAPGETRRLLQSLVKRFKTLGVTSVLTLEASSVDPLESSTLRSLSPLADNAVLLRYVAVTGGLRPTLTVLKTRGSLHSFDTHYLMLGKGGARIGTRIAGEPAPLHVREPTTRKAESEEPRKSRAK